MSSFDGFSEEMFAFLGELQFCNTMENLAENKLKYKSLITEPLTSLFYNLSNTASAISSSIELKPSRCISSMYSDMRFSKGTPLKTYMYIRFKEADKEKDVLGLYFDMGMDNYSYGIRIYKQTSAGMNTIRDHALLHKKEYSSALTRVNTSGAVFIGERFIRDHFPDVTDKRLRDFLNLRSFYICYEKPVSDTVFNRRLSEEISEGFIALKEIYCLIKDAR